MSDYTADRIRAHDHDGIQEFDNRLPNWWLWILYGSVVFSLLYWIVYHTMSIMPHPTELLAAEQRAAEQAQVAAASTSAVTDEGLVLMATNATEVAAGKEIFNTYCVVCHLAEGQGLVGPNLTDEYWIHGGHPTDLHEIVMEGVPAKGMAAWGSQLGPTRVQQVVSFLLTIRHTNVAGKAPEGELFVRGSEATP